MSSGRLNLLEAVRRASPGATVVVAGSSVEYGFVSPEEVPIKEERTLSPASPYGVSKVAAGMLSKLYAETHGLNVVRTRPFIVIGPGKDADVMSDFSKGIVAIERGRGTSLKVGNLEAVRDFLDVEDATSGPLDVGGEGRAGSRSTISAPAPATRSNRCSIASYRWRTHLFRWSVTPPACGRRTSRS